MAQVKGVYLDGAEATTALTSIESEYASIMRELNQIQNGAIESLQAGWKGQDCVDFINQNLIPAVKEAGNEIQKVFQSINDTVTQNAKNFERKYLKGQTVFKPVTHVMQKIALTAVAPFTGTIVGVVDAVRVAQAQKEMDKMQKQIEELLERARKAAQKSGFYGAGQQEKFNESMSKIKKSIGDLSGSIAKATGVKATNTVDEANELGKSNASTF